MTPNVFNMIISINVQCLYINLSMKFVYENTIAVFLYIIVDSINKATIFIRERPLT